MTDQQDGNPMLPPRMSKEWFMDKVKLEDGCAVSAGVRFSLSASELLNLSAGPFDKACTMVRELEEENKQLHAELLEIHTIAQCVAEFPEVQEGDSLTVKAVKGMAHQIKMLEQKMDIKDKQMDNLRIMEEQLREKVERYRAELNRKNQHIDRLIESANRKP